MLDYTELYEYVRKEKFSEQLQQLPKSFISDVSDFFKDRRKQLSEAQDLFSDDILRLKKQYENAVSIFKELMLRRKKKILNLVFVASETGIMKRDFGTMFPFEQGLFERLVFAVETADKDLAASLNGSNGKLFEHKLILVSEPISQFASMNGDFIGPFEKGQLVNVESAIADILVSDKKANYVDEP